jgi:hypothetical protein
MKAAHANSFPHLLGAVCCLHGGEGEIGAAIAGNGAAEWVAATTPTDLVLTRRPVIPSIRWWRRAGPFRRAAL